MQILALCVFSSADYPPPPKKIYEIMADLPNGKVCVASYHMWRLYPTRITTRFVLLYTTSFHQHRGVNVGSFEPNAACFSVDIVLCSSFHNKIWQQISEMFL